MKLSEVVKNEPTKDGRVMLCISDKSDKAIDAIIELINNMGYAKEHTQYVEDDDDGYCTYYAISRTFVPEFKDAYKQAKKSL